LKVSAAGDGERRIRDVRLVSEARPSWPAAATKRRSGLTSRNGSTKVKEMFAWAPNIQFSLVGIQGTCPGVHLVALITMPD
jgi:hypothetical protein